MFPIEMKLVGHAASRDRHVKSLMKRSNDFVSQDRCVKPKRQQQVYKHPLNVKPLANVLLSQSSDSKVQVRTPIQLNVQERSEGLGNLTNLPDEIILFILKHISPEALSAGCLISKALFIFCSTDSLWEVLCFQVEKSVPLLLSFSQKFGRAIPVGENWKSTYRKPTDTSYCPTLPQLYSDILVNFNSTDTVFDILSTMIGLMQRQT